MSKLDEIRQWQKERRRLVKERYYWREMINAISLMDDVDCLLTLLQEGREIVETVQFFDGTSSLRIGQCPYCFGQLRHSDACKLAAWLKAIQGE